MRIDGDAYRVEGDENGNKNKDSPKNQTSLANRFIDPVEPLKNLLVLGIFIFQFQNDFLGAFFANPGNFCEVSDIACGDGFSEISQTGHSHNGHGGLRSYARDSDEEFKEIQFFSGSKSVQIQSVFPYSKMRPELCRSYRLVFIASTSFRRDRLQDCCVCVYFVPNSTNI